MTSGEYFPNAPIRLVSFELRFPITRRVATRAVWDAFEEVFAADLPRVELLVRENDETQLPLSPNDPVLRRTTAERDRAVTLKYGALTVETTSYESYDKLRMCIKAATKALESIPTAPSITRLGLRYINEIQVPGLRGMVRDWAPYINPSLLAPVEAPPKGFSVGYVRGHLGFHSVGGDEHAYATYGRLSQSSLEPDGVLQLPVLEGPCFLLDIDSSRGSVRRPVAASRSEVLSVVDELHDAVEAVFNWSISDRLRDEVLRRDPASEPKERTQATESTHV
jgi:uncharacterized protein (TIGR04255 family)